MINTGPLTLKLRLRLAELAAEFGRVGDGDYEAEPALSRAAGELASALSTPEIEQWGTSYLPRSPTYRRTIIYLRVLEEQPELAITDRGIATLQLAADTITAWIYQTSEMMESRAQMGDAALLTLAAAPFGILMALGLGFLVAAPPELVDDLEDAAIDAAKKAADAAADAAKEGLEDAGAALWDGSPWAVGVAALLALYVLFHRVGSRP